MQLTVTSNCHRYRKEGGGKGDQSPALPPVRYTVPWMDPSGLRPVAHDPKRTAQVRNIVCLWPL